jgi:hypothetical protein
MFRERTAPMKPNVFLIVTALALIAVCVAAAAA